MGAPGHNLRPVHVHRNGQPSRGCTGHLPCASGQGLHLHRHYSAALLPRLSPIPPGPLREGHVPPLRQHGRTGRPVRPVWQAAEPGRPHRHPVPHLRRHPGDTRFGALLSEAERLPGDPPGLGQGAEALETQRAELHPALPGGRPEGPCHIQGP